MSAHIYIIILNWNGEKDTIECLEALSRSIYKNYTIVLIDNGSIDNLAAWVKTSRPDIVLFENAENVGFAEGNNIGIRYALSQGADYILLLNNDTVVDSHCLEALVRGMMQDEQIAVCAPKILHYRKKDCIESVGGRLSLSFAKNIALGYGEKDTGQYDQDQDVDFISGCAFFARARMFEVLGGFDKQYFAYYEDMLLCYKIREAGYRLRYVHDAMIWHKVSAASGGYKSPHAIFWSTRNRFLFLFACGKWFHILFFMIYFFFFYAPAFVAMHILERKRAHNHAFIRGILSTMTGSFRYVDAFPFHMAMDISAISQRKAGVGYYTMALMEAFGRQVSSSVYSSFRYVLSERLSPKILHVFMRLLWEQVLVPIILFFRRVDVAHFPAYVCPLIKTAIYIITIHDMAYLRYPKMFLPIYRFYLKLFVPLSARRADAVIAVSEQTKRDIVSFLHMPAEKIYVVYEGVDASFSLIKNRDMAQAVLKQYGIHGPFILHVGTLEPRKNIEGLIRAFKLFRDGVSLAKDYVLVLVGAKGWYYEGVFRLIKDMGLQDVIVVTDYVSDADLPILYGSASLLAYVSFYEGFGLPLVEAMACGCPILASNVSSIPEVLGDAGYLVNPKDDAAIARGMESILSDSVLREQLVQRGMIRANTFTWDRCAKETLRVYKKALERKRR